MPCLGPVPDAISLHILHLLQGLERDLAPNSVSRVAVSVEEGVALVVAGKSVKDGLGREGSAQRDEAAGQELGVDGNVGLCVEEGR